jgi:large subunit ribosomal protein L9
VGGRRAAPPPPGGGERARHAAPTAEQAETIAETLRKTVLRFEVNAGPQGTLFGSVTPTDVAEEIWRTRKVRVDRKKIDLPDPIKRVGRYEVPIVVFENVRVDVKTLVVPLGGELPPEEELEPAEADAEAETGETDGVPTPAAEAEAEAEPPADAGPDERA